MQLHPLCSPAHTSLYTAILLSITEQNINIAISRSLLHFNSITNHLLLILHMLNINIKFDSFWKRLKV